MMDKITQKDIDKILNGIFWPENLKGGESYCSTHDDNDGKPLSGYLDMGITPDGDVWIKSMIESIGYLRYRTYQGGGKFPKIRNALLVLAEAIRQEGKL